MDVKVVYVDPVNGTLSVLPETEAAGAGTTPLLRSPSSVSLAATYLTLSSAAIATNAMVLTGVLAADRLRTPYAVLASALCLQCALDATVGHCAATRELLQLSAGGGDGGGGGPVLCRGVATVTAALSVVQLVTFASLVSLGALIRPGYDELPLSAAAALWAAPSVYTYVILTPTLLFSVRYFPSRGRCGFVANGTGWFYPVLLVAFSFAIPWSVSLYFASAYRPPPSPSTSSTRPSAVVAAGARPNAGAAACKWMFASYTVLVTPGLISSFVRLYGPTTEADDNPWTVTTDDTATDALDGYLARLPVLFDAFVPLTLVYHHKAFRKKCRELYMHGSRNSVSDDSRGRSSGRRGDERLADDAPVLFLERSGVIGVRYPCGHGHGGFIARPCDHHVPAVGHRDKAVHFSRNVHNGDDDDDAATSDEQPMSRESRL